MSLSSSMKKKVSEGGFSERKVFDWNNIRILVSEEKNAYKKTKLILSLTQNNENVESHEDLMDESEDLLCQFITFFKMEKLFPNFLISSEENLKDKKNIKKSLSKRDEIKTKNEEIFIKNDFSKFGLDRNYNLLPHLNLRYEMNNYLYIVYWCVEILRSLKQGKRVKPLVILDASLSLNRMIAKGKVNSAYYLEGICNLQTRINQLMTEEFYSLLFANPKFIVSCSFQSIDSEIKLYKEQKELVLDIFNHCLSDKPRLLGSQLPTGEGKTFASIVLAKLLSIHLPEKTVLFACSNSLVNSQVATDSFFGDGLHLWLAAKALINGKDGTKTRKILIRPHKKCYKVNWKQSYKENNNDFKFDSIFKQWFFYKRLTQRAPDIIVSDLESCKELLKNNKALGFPFVLFLDEFITTEADGEIVAEIVREGLPKQTIIASSVLPKFNHLQTLVTSFCRRYNTTESDACIRQSSHNIKIPCCILDKNGFANFPHHIIDTNESLDHLILNIKTNPRIRRTYPAKHVFHWSKSIDHLLPTDLKYHHYFPNIGLIDQNQSNEYVVMLLCYLRDNFELLDVFKQYKPNIHEAIDINQIMTFDSYKLDVQGKTLIFSKSPTLFTQEKTIELFENLPRISSLIKQYENEKKGKEKTIHSLENKKSNNMKTDNGQSKNNSLEQINNLKNEIEMLQLNIPKNILLNTIEHYKRFHPDTDIAKLPPTIKERKLITLENSFHDHLSDQNIYELYSGILCYDSNNQSQYQRQLLMSVYNSSLFFVAGKEIIYGTNLPELVNIVLPEDAQELSNSEIYQLLGRCGRVGVSNFASIMTNDDITLYKLLSCNDIHEQENFVEEKLKSMNL